MAPSSHSQEPPGNPGRFSPAVRAVALAAFSSLTPSAADYDTDCKLLLCLPGSFPSGCADAFDHMAGRRKDGKSPIGFCAMSSGDAYGACEIEYGFRSVASPQGRDCPEGRTPYLKVLSDDDDDGFFAKEVRTFCFDAAYAQTGWTPDGGQSITTCTNKTPPERTDFWVDMTLEPGTASEFSQGVQAFDTGRAYQLKVSFKE